MKEYDGLVWRCMRHVSHMLALNSGLPPHFTEKEDIQNVQIFSIFLQFLCSSYLGNDAEKNNHYHFEGHKESHQNIPKLWVARGWIICSKRMQEMRPVLGAHAMSLSAWPELEQGQGGGNLPLARAFSTYLETFGNQGLGKCSHFSLWSPAPILWFALQWIKQNDPETMSKMMKYA